MPKEEIRQRVGPISLFFLCRKTGTIPLPCPGALRFGFGITGEEISI